MNADQPIRTSSLLRKLSHTASFPRFLQVYDSQLKMPQLSHYLNQLCKEKKLVREQVIQRAGIERSYGHQIFRGIRNPSRDKLIQLSFGMGLTAEECQALLKIASKPALYPKIKRDAAILYGLLHRLSYMEMQELLDDCSISLLGGIKDDI